MWTSYPKFLTKLNMGNDVSVEHIVEDERILQCKPRCPVGTGPFMAMEFLKKRKAPAHLYRHDLESFFWVLLYFIIVHNLEKHTLSYIYSWMYPDPEFIRHNKTQYLNNLRVGFYIMSTMYPRYEPIWSTTIRKLARLFSELYADNARFETQRVNYVEAMVARDRRAKKYWASKMVALCKKRNGMITYDALMEHLKQIISRAVFCTISGHFFIRHDTASSSNTSCVRI